jgi:fermentation-respiration switch protein FrsA (DUF1100 family)
MSAVLVVVAGVALALVLLWVLQRGMIYFPFGNVPDPASVGLPDAEPVTIRTADGETLQAWFVEASLVGGPSTFAEATADKEGPPAQARGTVIVFNGNAGNRAYRADLARALRERGLNVVLFDYRGYGGSTGRPSEAGLAADARAVRAHVASRKDVDATKIVYFGESLGAGVAVGLAVETPPAALVLRSPFTSLGDVGQLHYPLLPVKRLLRDRYPSLDRIARVACPIAVIAGDRDGIIPMAQSRAIFDAAREPKTWTVIEGADHNDAALVHGQEVVAAVTAIVDNGITR